MNFTDYFFLPLSLIGACIYFLFPQQIRWVWLLVMSTVFFATWGIELLPLILILVFLVWAGARIMEKRYDSCENDRTLLIKARQKNKTILIVLITLIVLMLAFIRLQRTPAFSGISAFFSDIFRAVQQFFLKIRVLNYFVSAGNGGKAVGLDNLVFRLLGISKKATVFSNPGSTLRYWIVPIGFSYYSLSLIGYLADVFWRKEKAEKNYFKLLLFTIYFPKILQGPISKHRTIAGRLYEGHAFNYDHFCFGLQRVVWGFFKKWVIADRVSTLVNTVFNNPKSHSGSEFLVAALFAAVQLYCDFSGCMDMGLGISECFGITLEENFNRPFFSCSAAEFWRRWHITLGTWFKDYVYMPISISSGVIQITGMIRKRFGKRTGKVFSTVIPLASVWLLTGLWHGTGANYLVWGAYWGTLIILSNILEPEFKRLPKWLKINTDSIGYRFFQRIRTFLFFVISRIISLPRTLDTTGYVFKSIFTDFAPWKLVDGTLFTLGINRPQFVVVMLAIALLIFVSVKQEQGIHIRQWIAARPLVVRWIIYYAVIFSVLVFGAYGVGFNAASFVYMAF